MTAHGLSGSRTVATLDGGEDLVMALKGFLFSFLGLKVLLSSFPKKVNKGKEKTFQNTVFCHPGQEVMKIGIGPDRAQAVGHLFFLFS
jgi:hypothetical protein